MYKNLFYQMNYEDAESLRLRYDMAFRMRVRGVAAWHITCLDFANTSEARREREAMWAVLPTGRAFV